MFQPSVFLSHGAPDLALKTDHPTYHFLQELPKALPRPDAIVIFSAHWCTPQVMVSQDVSYRAVHDFGGFDERLYALRYAPKGCPELAKMVLDMVKHQDDDAKLVVKGGLDHGVWIPLLLMYPDPFIPVVQVSIQPDKSPAYHLAVGKSLQELRSHNVLVIGSGSMTHNLYAMNWNDHDAPPPRWVSDFTDWMHDRLEAGDTESVLHYRNLAPYAQNNHPTSEHLLPLFVAMGAGGAKAKRIHTASAYATVGLDAYQFS